MSNYRRLLNAGRHRVWALALLLLGFTAAFGATAPAFKAGVFDPARQAPDFTLVGTNNQDLKLSRYRGKVVLLAFGYSSCQSVCPTTLNTFAQTVKELGAGAADVQVVYVTVDPGRDTPVRLKAFLDQFNKGFVGGTGTEQQLQQVRRDYGVSATKIPDGKSYMYDHSSFIYLIDRSGRIRALMPYGHPPEDFAHDLRILLAE